jgi:hypothetical protein
MRVYFDKQIYSNLFKLNQEKYITLSKKIEQRNFIICYSHALLLDLKNDKTDFKYKELDFIESLVNDNYISYHALNKVTSAYLAKPREAFEDVENETTEIDFEEIFNFDIDGLSNEEKQIIKSAREMIFNTDFDMNFIDKNSFPEEHKELFSKLFPEVKSSLNLKDAITYFMDFIDTLNEDKSIYKQLRNLSSAYLNNKKFEINYNEIDFNDELKNSALKKTFLEHIEQTINPNGKKDVSKYDYFTNSYLNLDILGISKESAKNVKFRNLMNDAFHSYYGAYCDCVVSEDIGFIKKTRVLYNLFNISTKVLHVDEFIEFYDILFPDLPNNAVEFFEKIGKNIEHWELTEHYSIINLKRTISRYKTNYNILSYFNRAEYLLEKNKKYIYLFRERNNYSSFDMYREYEFIVNNAHKIFGTDINSKTKYSFKEENDLIKKDKWKGRFWDFGTYTLFIEHSKENKSFGVLIQVR